MERQLLWLFVLSLCLKSATVLAVFQDTDDHAKNVNDRVYSASRGQPAAEALRAEASRQEASRLYAERIRRLPPKQVAAWVAGSLSEEDVERLASEAPAEPESAPDALSSALTFRRGRVMRLTVVGGIAALLAALIWFERYRAQKSSLRVERACASRSSKGADRELVPKHEIPVEDELR